MVVEYILGRTVSWEFDGQIDFRLRSRNGRERGRRWKKGFAWKEKGVWLVEKEIVGRSRCAMGERCKFGWREEISIHGVFMLGNAHKKITTCLPASEIL